MAEIIKIEKEKTTYNGEIRNGYFLENYKFLKGTKCEIADAYINAKNEKSAVNALLKKLKLNIYKYIEDLQNDIESGYITIETVNYYDEETDQFYKYYVSVIYAI